MKAKVILFEEVNVMTLLFAFYYQARNFQIKYLTLSGRFQNAKMVEWLSKFHIEKLTYEDIPQMAHYNIYGKAPTYVEATFKKYYENNPLVKDLEKKWGLNKKQQKRFHFALEKTLFHTSLYHFLGLLLFVEHLKKYADISLFIAPNFIITESLKAHPKVKNFYPKILTNYSLYAYLLEKILVKIFANAKGKLSASFRKIFPQKTQKDLISTDDIITNNVTDFNHEIIYFPNKGIYYANLFLKDQYHSNNPESPYYYKKILHLSIGDAPSDLTKSKKYYYEKGIPFFEFLNFPHESYVSFCKKCLKLFNRHRIFLIKDFLRHGFGPTINLLRSYLSIEFSLGRLSALPKLKIALIGYPPNFSPMLSVALGIKKIKIVATQERFIHSYMPTFQNFFLDHYFVVGNKAKEAMRSYKYGAQIGEIKPLGPIRVSLIHKEQMKDMAPKYKRLSKGKFFVLCLLFHSEKFEWKNRECIGNSWKTNKKFIHDVLALANNHPDAFFVFKEKSYSFPQIESFKKEYDLIQKTPNATVEEDLDSYNPYQMASYCDMAIAMHTSIGDELLAIGRPVLFYDYFDYPSPYLNYDGHPVIVRNFTDLEKRFAQVKRDKETLMPKEDFQKFRHDFYTLENHQNIKKILHQNLDDIYHSTSTAPNLF